MKVIYIRKKSLFVMLLTVIVLLVLLVLIMQNNRAVPVLNILLSDKIIGIDPGHGGIDSGAVGITGVEEDKINLSIALKLKKIIMENGGIVVMTRETEEGLYTEKSNTLKEMKTEDLHNRKAIIDEGNCDIFISIHLNSFEQSKYYGAQTFYHIGDGDSKDLAYSIQEQLRRELDENNHRIPQETEEIFLLKERDIPSVLVECGFLSNPNEEKLLISDKYQEKIALAIYNGVVKFLINNNVDKKL